MAQAGAEKRQSSIGFLEAEDGWQYEADQRHADIIVNAKHMEEGKEVMTAGEDPKGWEEEQDKVALTKEQHAEYRALVARANYLASDRVDIQYAVKELCRGMSAPTVGHKKMLKRLARYLVGAPRLISEFPLREDNGRFGGSQLATGLAVREQPNQLVGAS